METNNQENESWTGAQGFDEAQYYRDQKFEIGIEHSDETVKERVLEAFRRNPGLSVADIKVEVRDGLVILSGEVPGFQERREASMIIQSLSGVKAVKNLLDF